VKFKVAPLAEIARAPRPRAIGGAVQLRVQRRSSVLDEGRLKASSSPLIIRTSGLGHRRGITCGDQMDQQARAFDMAEETDAEACA